MLRFEFKIRNSISIFSWHKTDLSKVVANGTSPEDPIIFLKPTSSYLSEGNLIHVF